MTPNFRIAFHTLGCKLNYSETSAISRKFSDKGFLIVDYEDFSDIYVINTCSVTDHADRKCKKFVRDALKINPDAKIVVIGCYAQLKPEEIVSIPGVNMVLGAAEKFDLDKHIDQLFYTQEPQILNSNIKEIKEFNNSYSMGDRTRSFLKVQDGCDYFCSFCTIPLARGKSRSDYIENIVKSANEIADSGVKEIVLTGVNTGDFSNDKNETFLDLIQALDKVGRIERFRISSIEPNLLTNDIIEFVALSDKFVPHFHIPLQSGSDKILKLMRRKYDSSLYKQRIHTIKQLIPDSCIGVDVITGFPGETDEDFMQTYEFLKKLDISYLHVFTYSERQNTTAVKLKDKVSQNIRTERRKMLQNLSHKKKFQFYKNFIGQISRVLIENNMKDGYLYGFTDNYLKVKIKPAENKKHLLINTLQNVNLIKQESEIIEGTLAPQFHNKEYITTHPI